MRCGGGTGIFLVVPSTYIIVVRGRRACLWGSLYLDEYYEEDRDLRYHLAHLPKFIFVFYY